MTPQQSQNVVLITGGSRGIGKALVQKFKDQNWKVAACARSEQSLHSGSADLKLGCDVGKVEQIKQAIEKVKAQFGRIDVLINNAGLAGNNSLDPQSSDELWHQIVNVNLNGTYYMCKYAAPYLPDQTGRIINIGSVLSLKGVPDQTAYCAAKHAVLGFTRAFSHTLAPRKITVNTICPGWVRTDMAFGRFKELGMTEADLKSSVPLSSFVEPRQVAELAFLIATSDAFSMVTGQALTIDGGVLA